MSIHQTHTYIYTFYYIGYVSIILLLYKPKLYGYNLYN